MVKYECKTAYRPRFGPIGICDECVTEDCTNPIHTVKINVLGSVEEERLWSESGEPKRLQDCYCVLECKGFEENAIEPAHIK